MAKETVLIVDDNITFRDLMREYLSGIGDIEVVGSAPNGKLGLERAQQASPDLVIVSETIPDLSAAGFTRRILSMLPQAGVIVTTRDTPEAARNAVEALGAGAFDFLVKEHCTENTSRASLDPKVQRLLLSKIRCHAITHYSQLAQKLSPSAVLARNAAKEAIDKRPVQVVEKATSLVTRRHNDRTFEAVVVGVSTGGPDALAKFLAEFPETLPLPIVIVLHMPKNFTGPMAQELNKKSRIRVVEATDGEMLSAGTVYLARGGIHLEMARGTRGKIVLNTVDGAPENGCKPSADVLFRSAASVCKGRVIGAILTGMGSDGTKGLVELKNHGVPVFAQDEKSSVVWGMPGSAVKAGVVDEVLSLPEIAQAIIQLAGGK